jgi:hypothetical protein
MDFKPNRGKPMSEMFCKMCGGPRSVGANFCPHCGITLSTKCKGIFVDDMPLRDSSFDKLNRLPFAQRIARTIADRRYSSSIVIGILGMWGEGKTTVINFIENEFEENHPDVIYFRFNPWMIGDETDIILRFFATMAEVLGKKIETKKEIIGTLLKEYSFLLAPLYSLDKVVGGAGQKLSAASLEDKRNRIDSILNEAAKRVVISIDDIDRLDKKEIQTIIKLVKLTADFNYTSYILAFDETVVAAALREQYPDAADTTGILEKIIQVPLRLPKAESIGLRALCFEDINNILIREEILLAEEERNRFIRLFASNLELRIKTPRMMKRYCNALSFLLPMLKDEVNMVDLMLIEGIKVCYPELYKCIRENSVVFLGSSADQRDSDPSSTKERRYKIINSTLEELGNGEKEAAKALITELFPRTQPILRDTNVHWLEPWEATWANQQLIRSKYYFSRYFLYTVPREDIPDRVVKTLINVAETSDSTDMSTMVQAIASNWNVDALISKLRILAKTLPIDVALNLAETIAVNGDIFPYVDTALSHAGTFSQAGMLVGDLVERQPSTDRFDFVKRIISLAEPVWFASECLRWIPSQKEGEPFDESSDVLSSAELKEVGKILSDRIKILMQGQSMFDLPSDTLRLLYDWERWGNKDEVTRFITKTFEEDPRNAINFIKLFLKGHDLLTGNTIFADLSQEHYDAITQLAGEDVVFNALQKIYGSAFDSAHYEATNDTPLDEKIAYQFAFLFHGSRSKNNSEANSNDATT